MNLMFRNRVRGLRRLIWGALGLPTGLIPTLAF